MRNQFSKASIQNMVEGLLEGHIQKGGKKQRGGLFAVDGKLDTVPGIKSNLEKINEGLGKLGNSDAVLIKGDVGKIADVIVAALENILPESFLKEDVPAGVISNDVVGYV